MKNLAFILSLCIAFSTQTIAQDWDKIYKEVEGMRVAMKDNKYGFVDAAGKTIVSAIYDDAFDFDIFGNAVVKKNGKFGCINKSGKISVSINYDKIFSFQKNGLTIVKNNNKQGCINKEGETIIPTEYDKIYPYKEGYTLLLKNNKYGYANTSGEIVIPVMYDDAFDFKNGKATVVLNNKKGKVNTAGKVTWGLAIGDYAHGGVVIKLDESGEHGVVCAIGDCGGFGKEWQFTDAESCAEGIRSKVKGKMWRLPNLDELKLIHKHGDLIRKTSTDHGDSNGFRGDYYWSSKKDYNNRFNHYVGHLRGGGGMMTQIADINAKHSVRAVRDF